MPVQDKQFARLHQRVASIRRDLEQLSKDSYLAPMALSLNSQLDDLIRIASEDVMRYTEGLIRPWVDIATQWTPFLKEYHVLEEDLEKLGSLIEECLSSGLWHWEALLPDWAQKVDPAKGGSVSTFEAFLILLAALDETYLPELEFNLEEVMDRRLDVIREAVKVWITKGHLPGNIQEGGIDADIIPDPATAARWRAIEEFASGWWRRVSGRSDTTGPVDFLEERVELVHQSLADIEALGRIPEGQGYHDTFRDLNSLLEAHIYAISRPFWEEDEDWKERQPKNMYSETLTQIADRELNLHFFPELPDFIKWVKRLWTMIQHNQVDGARLFETFALCTNLLLRSGNTAVTTISRILTTARHYFAERGEIPDHEVRMMELEETFARGLAIYERLDVPGFISRLHRIEGSEEPTTPNPPIQSIKSEDWPEKIVTPNDAETLLDLALEFASEHLSRHPLDPTSAELHLLLCLLQHGIAYESYFPKEEILKILRRLEHFVPELAERMSQTISLLIPYYQGKRIATRTIFLEILEAQSEELQRNIVTFGHAEAGPMWAAALRQVRAMQRWTADGRTPTAEEREQTHIVIENAIQKLEGKDSGDSDVARLDDLDRAFSEWEELDDDQALPIIGGTILSSEKFLERLEDLTFECHELAHGPAFAEPTPIQQAILEVESHLHAMQTLTREGKESTTSQREMVGAISQAAAKVDPELCPTIPDFKQSLVSEVARLLAWFNQLMASSEFSALELRPLDWQGIRQPRTGGRGKRAVMAFILSEGDHPGVYRCGYEGFDAGKHTAGDLVLDRARFEPNDDGLELIFPSEGRRLTELSWDPSGYFLAFRFPGESEVGWVQSPDWGSTDWKSRLKGTTAGSGYAWSAKGDALIVANADAGEVARIDLEGNRARIADLDDRNDPQLPPQLTVSPSGSRMAFTSRSPEESTTDIRMVEIRGHRPVVNMLKHVPDNHAMILPFWLGSTELGALILTPDGDKSTLLSFGLKDAEEETLYQADGLLAPVAPVVSNSGRYIVFFNSSELVLFDRDQRVLLPLNEPLPEGATLAFGKQHIVVASETSVYLIDLLNFKDVREGLTHF